MRVFAIGLFTALILFVAAGSVLAEGDEGAQTPYPLTTGGGLVGIGAGLGAGLVVVGAVEEEIASSRGAHAITRAPSSTHKRRASIRRPLGFSEDTSLDMNWKSSGERTLSTGTTRTWSPVSPPKAAFIAAR